jgi:osmoprotectant transport system permease protein
VNIAAALTVYAVALLVRSVVDGLRSVPEEVRQSASAMGYGRIRRLLRVELPLAMPVVFAGLRVVTVSNIALVSVGAVIGMGALGQLFDLGFTKAFYTPIVVGLVLTMVLALLADGVILLLQRGLLPWHRGRTS